MTSIRSWESSAAKDAGLDKIIDEIKASGKKQGSAEVKCPPKEPVPYGILGVEVMDLDSAKEALWAKGIYAETGMGCTGPVILVSDANGIKECVTHGIAENEEDAGVQAMNAGLDMDMGTHIYKDYLQKAVVALVFWHRLTLQGCTIA